MIYLLESVATVIAGLYRLGVVIFAMKAVFPRTTDDVAEKQAALRRAVQKVCNELVEVHHVEEEKLSLLVDIISQTILESLREGHGDASVLAEFAAMKALGHLGYKPN